MSRLVKGVEIGRYFFRTRLSQGHKEWFDEKAFLKKNGFKGIVKLRRIATQRITGVDERLRLVATIVDPLAYFADSTNSITCSPRATHKLEYLLGLLNSKLMQWRFKLTSTNNNVGTNELDSLPIRRIDFEQSVDRSRHDRMSQLVTAIIKGQKQLAAAKNERDRMLYENKCSTLDWQIDQLVYELYDLTSADIKLIEQPLHRPRATIQRR